jgi:hypothetical protein
MSNEIAVDDLTDPSRKPDLRRFEEHGDRPDATILTTPSNPPSDFRIARAAAVRAAPRTDRTLEQPPALELPFPCPDSLPGEVEAVDRLPPMPDLHLESPAALTRSRLVALDQADCRLRSAASGPEAVVLDQVREVREQGESRVTVDRSFRPR